MPLTEDFCFARAFKAMKGAFPAWYPDSDAPADFHRALERFALPVAVAAMLLVRRFINAQAPTSLDAETIARCIVRYGQAAVDKAARDWPDYRPPRANLGANGGLNIQGIIEVCALAARYLPPPTQPTQLALASREDAEVAAARASPQGFSVQELVTKTVSRMGREPVAVAPQYAPRKRQPQ